jgi:hypothetical protein
LGGCALVPLLPSIAPRAAEIPAPKRLVVAVMPNGLYTPSFQPLLAGPDYELPEILAPFGALRPRLSVLSGVGNLAQGVLDHPAAMTTLLTDGPYVEGCTTCTISVDQAAADALGAESPFRSLQVGVKNATAEPVACLDVVSWGAIGQPFPPVEDPAALFDRLFGVRSDPAAALQARLAALDRVATRAASLGSRLEATDRVRLQQYESGLTELRARLESWTALSCEVPDPPPANPAYELATQLQYDLLFHALQCDLTRVATFMQGPTLSDEVYSFVGATAGTHRLSHDAWSSETYREQYVAVGAWQVARFVELVQRLADTPDVDGSDMLSNTICILTTEFAQANEHSATGPDPSLPLAVAGGENLGIRQGVHRVYSGENTGNVWLAVLQHLGLPWPSFGLHGVAPIDLSS